MAINVCGECAKVEVLSCIEGTLIYTGLDHNVNPSIRIRIETPWGDIAYSNYPLGNDDSFNLSFVDFFPIESIIKYNGSFIITAVDQTTLEPVLLQDKNCIELVINNISEV